MSAMIIHKSCTRRRPSRWRASCVFAATGTRRLATYVRSLVQSECKPNQRRRLLLTRPPCPLSKLKSNRAALLWRAQLRATTSHQIRLRSASLVHARNTIISAASSKTRTSTFTRTIRIRRASAAHFITAVAAASQATRFKFCSVSPVPPHTISSALERIVVQLN